MIKIITKRNKEFDKEFDWAISQNSHFNEAEQQLKSFNLQTMLEIAEEEIRLLEGEKVKDDCICGLGNDECLRQCAGGYNSAISKQIQFWSSQRDEIKKLIK